MPDPANRAADLKFFSDEVTRYRDLEWKLPAYSGGFMLAVMINKDKLAGDFNPFALGVAILLFGGFVCFAQTHVHNRLEVVRTRRDELIDVARGNPLSNRVYRLGFVGFNLLMTLAAFWSIIPRDVTAKIPGIVWVALAIAVWLSAAVLVSHGVTPDPPENRKA